MAKGYVIFDLAAMYGGAKFIPSTPLPRHDKKVLEFTMANTLLRSLAKPRGSQIAAIRSNPNDPPDVLFEINHQTVGLEMAELLPENRLERDAIIAQLKERILQELPLGPHTRDWVITVMLADDYAAKMRLRLEGELAAALNGFFSSSCAGVRAAKELPIPACVEHSIRCVHVVPCDLAGDPRVKTRDQPLIIFSAQNTNVVPDRDFPPMLEAVLGRKACHDLALRTWLLLWSNHHSLGPLNDELLRYIEVYVQQHEIRYERVFYLHLHAPFPGGITEFALRSS